MPGRLLEVIEESSWEHEHRWRPINSLKNSRVTVHVICSLSGKSFNVPDKPVLSTGDLQNYFDEAPEDHILGSTTLQEMVKRAKKNRPGMDLWDEEGGGALNCGPHHITQDEWETTMVCELICEERTESEDGEIPRVVLDDGREAVVVTIGNAGIIRKTKTTALQRCLARGDVYG